MHCRRRKATFDLQRRELHLCMSSLRVKSCCYLVDLCRILRPTNFWPIAHERLATLNQCCNRNDYRNVIDRAKLLFVGP